MSEQNLAATHRFFEVWNSGDLDALDEIMAEDVVDHDAYNVHAAEGREGAKKSIAMYRQAFSDLKMAVDAELAAGDVVVVRWHAEGTHDGEIMGLPPTGNGDTTHGMSWIRYQDGKAVESWTQWDVLGFMQSIGAVPSAESAAAN